MSRENRRSENTRPSPLGLAILLALLSIGVLLLVACGPSAPPAAEAPAATATSAPSPTDTLVPPTDTPEPEATNTLVPPTDTPEPEAPEAAVTPGVTVADQEIADGTVTVAEVVSSGPGWLVVHAQADGRPGPVIGYAAVADGSNTDVIVEVDATNATETLYAMLHVDAGTVGTYEFPGDDGPVSVDGQVITPPFQITGGLPAAQADAVTFVIVPDQTTAQYSIEEIFINQDNRLNTAVGKTNEVSGQLTLNYPDPTASQFGEFVVDISTLTSDADRRDNAIRERWLESAAYPLATFVVREVRGFPSDPQEGQPIEFQLVGDMTVKETTREQVWDVVAVLEGDQLAGTATTFLLLEDYNVPVPNILNILKVTDGLTASLDFVMQAVEG